MKKVFYLVIAVLLVGGLDASVSAQKKKPVKRNQPVKTQVTPKPAVTSVMIIAKTKVSNQRSNVSQFVDVLGPIAQGIENIDAEAKTKRLSRETLAKNDDNKKKVVAAIRNLRTGIVNLETEFRTKPDLRRFLVNIQGVSDLCASAEDSALAGKFVAAKDPLRTISRKLTDTLAMMP
ncbi:MAG: hypothetical protein ABI539_13810 [Acidobacteriota bacterium]